MSFPRAVNVQPAIAVAGDFASANQNKYSVIAGVGAFIAGPAGLTVGAFAWADPTYTFLNSFGTGAPTGFIAREGLRADIITPGPGFPDSSQTILGGSYVSAFSRGDFYVINNGGAATAIGQTCYALNNSGLASFGAAGSPPTSGTCTGGTIAKIVSASTGGALPTTNTCTAGIAGTVMTVSAVGSGSVLGAGQTISGTGIDPGTTIVNQLTGTAGSTGTYTVSISQTVAGGTAVTMSGGGLTLTGANTTGVFAPGMTISGTNIPTGTTILGYGTGTAGGAGTYYVDRPAVTAATASTITATNAMFMTVDSSSTGTWSLYDLVTGTGVAAGSSIIATGAQNANLTGTGGAGTYLLSGDYTAVTAETLSVNTGTATNWVAQSVGAVGELVAIAVIP